MPESLTYEQGAMVEPLSNAGKALPAAVVLALPVLEGLQVRPEAFLTPHVSMQAVQNPNLAFAGLQAFGALSSAFCALLLVTLGSVRLSAGHMLAV